MKKLDCLSSAVSEKEFQHAIDKAAKCSMHSSHIDQQHAYILTINSSIYKI